MTADKPTVGGDVLFAFREHRIPILITLLYVLSGLLIERFLDLHGIVNVGFYSHALMNMTLHALVFYLCFHGIWTMFKVGKNQNLFRAAWHHLYDTYLYRSRILGFVIIFVFFPAFLSMFSSYKQAIPFLTSYTWDETFMHWDKVIHGGHHPWELLQPILGYPIVSCFINGCYQLWFFVMFAVVFWQSWNTKRLERMQFMLSFMFVWILLGTIMATMLPSAGPCYYDRITGTTGPYGDLMSYLHQASESFPLWSLDIQERLWRDYSILAIGKGGGISAMPSMHVSIAVLCALVGWKANRTIGIILTAFAVIIQLGTVHLGWHYAVDGYVSTVLTIVIWKATGWAVYKYSTIPAELHRPCCNAAAEVPEEDTETADARGAAC